MNLKFAVSAYMTLGKCEEKSPRGLSARGILVCVMLFASLSMARPVPARAQINPDVRTMMVGSVYGLVGGTLLGLLSYPLHRSVRSVFIGSSVGLYLGAAVGAYHMVYHDDPQNPFSSLDQIEKRPIQLNWTLVSF